MFYNLTRLPGAIKKSQSSHAIEWLPYFPGAFSSRLGLSLCWRIRTEC